MSPTKKGSAAARRAKAAKDAWDPVREKLRNLRERAGRERERDWEEFMDWTEPDDLDRWLAGQLHDYQLLASADTINAAKAVLEGMLTTLKTEREGVKNDLRREGYLDGQINVLETIINQFTIAAGARMRRIGEDPSKLVVP